MRKNNPVPFPFCLIYNPLELGWCNHFMKHLESREHSANSKSLWECRTAFLWKKCGQSSKHHSDHLVFFPHTLFVITKLLGSDCNMSRRQPFLSQLSKMCCRPKDNLLKTFKKISTGTGGSDGDCLKQKEVINIIAIDSVATCLRSNKKPSALLSLLMACHICLSSLILPWVINTG